MSTWVIKSPEGYYSQLPPHPENSVLDKIPYRWSPLPSDAYHFTSASDAHWMCEKAQ